MSINTYPATSDSGLISSSSVYISSGAIGTPAEGFYGTEFTVNKSLPSGYYQAIVYCDSGSGTGINLTISSRSIFLASRNQNQPFPLSNAVSSYKAAATSGWRTNTVASVINSAISGLAFGNGRFVIRGTLTTAGTIQVSTNGVNWATASAINTISMTPSNLNGDNSLSFGNGYFFSNGSTAGQLTLSTDGLNWTSRGVALTSVGIINRVVYNGTYYLAMPVNGLAAISTNLTTWTTSFNTNTPWSPRPYRIQAVNGLFAVPNASVNGQLVVSSDGVNFTTRGTGLTAAITCIAYGNNTYVATSENGGIAISTDFTTWTNKTPTNFGSAITYIEYANGYFMTVGVVGGNAASKTTSAYSSTDGNVWTSRSLNPMRNNNDTCHLVAYGNSIWLAVPPSPSGGSQYFTSPSVAGYADYTSGSDSFQSLQLEGYNLDLNV